MNGNWNCTPVIVHTHINAPEFYGETVWQRERVREEKRTKKLCRILKSAKASGVISLFMRLMLEIYAWLNN